MPFEDPVPEMPDIDNTGKHAAEYKKYISAVKFNINKALAEQYSIKSDDINKDSKAKLSYTGD